MKKIHHNLLLLSTLLTGTFLTAQTVDIKDANFKTALVKLGVDKNKNGQIELAEAQQVTTLALSNKKIKNLEGIEAFTDLKNLDCSKNVLTSLDVSSFSKLQTLNCDDNLLKVLRLHTNNNWTLTSLSCERNSIGSLSTSKYFALIGFFCAKNKLSSLDLQYNTKLQSVDCRQNSMTSICVSSVHNTRFWQKDYFAKWTVCSGSDNALYIPDVNFRAALFALKVDKDNDGWIEYDEAAQVTDLHLGGKDIASLTGIEAFSNLKSLALAYNNLSYLNVENNKALSYLEVPYNPMQSLRVSASLEHLIAEHTLLSNIDLSGCLALKRIHMNFTPLESLDLSHNIALEQIDVDDTKLSKILFGYNPALKILICNGNPLRQIDISSLTGLKELYISGNQLSRLDISHNTALTLVHCLNNPLTDICIDTAQQHLTASWVKEPSAQWTVCSKYVYIPDANFKETLTALHVDQDGDGHIQYAEAAQVGALNLDNKDIQDLTGIEAFTGLNSLSCGHNNISTLDLSNNTQLTFVYCSFNPIQSVHIANNVALQYLICEYTLLDNLDLSTNSNLIVLDLRNNLLTTLDLRNNVALQVFHADLNPMEQLLLGDNSALQILDCNGNRFTSLDLSKLTSLQELYVSDNQLSSLDLRHNLNLVSLNCYDNDLSQICIHESQLALSSTWGKQPEAAWIVCDDNSARKSTDLGTQTSENLCEVYPNPAQDVLHVQSASPLIAVRIKDLQGHVVFTANTHTLDVSSLPRGMYCAEIVTEAGTMTKKFSIQ